jgi:hypothetical protein
MQNEIGVSPIYFRGGTNHPWSKMQGNSGRSAEYPNGLDCSIPTISNTAIQETIFGTQRMFPQSKHIGRQSSAHR